MRAVISSAKHQLPHGLAVRRRNGRCVGAQQGRALSGSEDPGEASLTPVLTPPHAPPGRHSFTLQSAGTEETPPHFAVGETGLAR